MFRRGAIPACSAHLIACVLFLASLAAHAAATNGGPPWIHAYAAYGEPKYPRDFHHFDYVNPEAPKGGTLHLRNPDRRTSFDKFNPYTIRGNAPAGVDIFMFESLAVMAGDELSTMYGLIAGDMQVAPDKSWVAFRLRPEARFTNGDRVTADDVKYAFDTLTSKLADPLRRSRLAGTRSATVLDERTIRFDLKERSTDAILNLGTRLPIFSRKWGAGPDGKPKPFDQIVHEHPIATGPYTIAVADSGRRLEFVRDPNYWARDLGVRRGMFNFDRVVYRYYQDGAVAIEAFKAGEFDILQEYSARRWARQHAGPKWRDGRIVKRTVPNAFGTGLQSYQFNLRRPLFQDRRIREAIGYTYDFEAVNAYKQYKRSASMFANSEFAASGMPGPGELALLEPFRAELPAEVFGPAWEPPRTDIAPTATRQNLLKARALLESAGWKVAPDGVLRNGKGEPFELELLEDVGARGRVEAVWEHNFAKLGMRFKVREVDYALMTKRQEAFDFDVVHIKTTDFAIPKVGDLRDQYSSKTADETGSNNLRGVKSRVVDFLLDRMDAAQTLDELRDACRALDRVIIHQHYQVPVLYTGTYRLSHWDRFGIPQVAPKYYTIESGLDIWPVWSLSIWWSRDSAAKRS